jgi:hypothetical protein
VYGATGVVVGTVLGTYVVVLADGGFVTVIDGHRGGAMPKLYPVPYPAPETYAETV